MSVNNCSLTNGFVSLNVHKQNTIRPAAGDIEFAGKSAHRFMSQIHYHERVAISFDTDLIKSEWA